MSAGQIVHNMFSIIDCRAFERLHEVFHPEVVYQRPGFPDIQGITELIHFYQQVRIVKDGVHTIRNLVCEGENLVCIGEFSGVSAEGKSLATRFSDVYGLKNGKIALRETYFFKPYI